MIVRRIFCNKVSQSYLLRFNPLLLSSRTQSTSSSELDWTRKSVYPWFLPVQTRWLDNDQYGHINNAVYHAIFDSVINGYLMRNAGLDSTPIGDCVWPKSLAGYMATNSCTFHGSASYPNIYMAGFSIEKIGRTSVSYRLGLFPLADPGSRVFVDLMYGHEWSDPLLDMVGERALVTGHSVHVLVNPATGQKVEISEEWRSKLRPLTPLPLV